MRFVYFQFKNRSEVKGSTSNRSIIILQSRPKDISAASIFGFVFVSLSSSEFCVEASRLTRSS